MEPPRKRRTLATIFVPASLVLLAFSIVEVPAASARDHQASPAPPTESADGLVAALVWLSDQPAGAIARSVGAPYRARLAALRAEVGALRRASASPLAEVLPQAVATGAVAPGDLGAGPVADPTASQREALRTLHLEIDALRDAMRREVAARIADAVAGPQAELDLAVTALGGEVVRRIPIVNAAAVRLPAESLALLADTPGVARVERLIAGRAELDDQKQSLGLNAALGPWNAGIDGATYDAGILDTGVQQDHPALDHLSFESLIGTTDADGHGTAVAGIVGLNDADMNGSCLTEGFFCGMSWAMDTMLVGSADAMDVLADADWMVTTAMEGPEAINLSFGYGTADDVDYSGFDAFWDALVDTFGLTVCTSAGDGGAIATSITHPANAYNVISVANMDDQNTVSRADDVADATSSRGPTLGGRKKPDLAAPGTSTRTANNDWAVADDFVDASGTSAAAPHCTGAALLITDDRADADPLAVKALLINTADPWTDGGTPGDTSDDGPVGIPGWNSTYGWGYIDLEQAHRRVDTVLTDTIGGPLDPEFRYFFGPTVGRITLTWNRHVAANGSSEPTDIEDFTNLDMALYNEATDALIGDSTSTLDNVEQIRIVGINDFVAKVMVTGSVDPDIGSEPFAVAAGQGDWIAADPPELNPNPAERPYPPGRRATLRARIRNEGDFRSHDNEITAVLPAGYVIESGANPQQISSIRPSATVQAPLVSWVIGIPCTLDPAMGSIDAVGTYTGETAMGSTAIDLTPSITPLVPGALAQVGPLEQAYSFEVEDGRWTVVLLGEGTIDLWADDDMCFGSPYQTSTIPGTAHEMVLANGAFYGDATHFALVTTLGPLSSFAGNIEHEGAADLTIGIPEAIAFGQDEVLEARQFPVVAGQTYDVLVQKVSQTGITQPDVAVFLWQADRDDGDAQNADLEIDASTGNDEAFSFQAAASGNVALAVLRIKSVMPTDYEILVTEAIFADGFESGDTSAWSQTIP